MQTQPGEADAGCAVAPGQHAGRFAGRSWLGEAAQIGPVAFGRAKMRALVAQRLLRRSEKIRSRGRRAERRQRIGDARSAVREPKEMTLVGHAERVPRPALIGARRELHEVLAVPLGGFDKLPAPIVLRGKREQRGNEAGASVDDVQPLVLRRQASRAAHDGRPRATSSSESSAVPASMQDQAMPDRPE